MYLYSWPWQQITAYADIGILMPAAIALTVWLLAAKNWRAALCWLAVFIVGMGITGVSKLAFIGWGWGVESYDFTGFSGHAMRAAAIFPVALYLLPWPAARAWRVAAVVFGLLLGALIAYSRLMVGAHSVSESVTGALLGSACAGVFLYYVWGQKIQVPIWLIALCLAFFALTPSKHSTPTHSWLIGVAMQISGHDRPFLRECWCFPPEPWITPGNPDGWRKQPPYPPMKRKLQTSIPERAVIAEPK